MQAKSLPVFMESVPKYEIRHDHMCISFGALQVVMPVGVFLDGIAQGEAAVAKWHLTRLSAKGSNVVPIRNH